MSDELPGAIKSLSALTFLSLLWLSFTLLEAADVPTPGQDKKDNDDDEEMWVFLRTDVQIFLGATACLGWMRESNDGLICERLLKGSKSSGEAPFSFWTRSALPSQPSSVSLHSA